MKNITSTIGIHYGNNAALLANITSWCLRLQHGQIMDITDIGSSDTTDVEHNGIIFETNYSYIYQNEQLIGIRLQCDDSLFLRDGITVSATDEMIDVYKEIMLSTYLLGECNKITELSDEAMAHGENWQEAI